MLAILPSGQPEYTLKTNQFVNTVNPIISRMYQYLGFAFLFSAVGGNLATRAFEGGIASAMIIGYVPVILAMIHMIRTFKGLPEVIKGIFGSWEAHGLTVNYFPGNKHAKPRLGFKITEAARQRLAEAGQQQTTGQQQQQTIRIQPGSQPMPSFQPMQPMNFHPIDTMTGAPIATATVVPDNACKVQVQVPAYGGGGVTGVMYNGAMISVEVPKDAKAGTTIWVDVPAAYRK
jgi:hypothetical protein